MSDETDIEKLKLEYADRQARRDFWKWVLMGIGFGLNAFVPIATSYIEQRVNAAAAKQVVAKVEAVAEKTDKIDAKADENFKTNLRTNIAVNDWKAQSDKDPMAALHADESRLKLEQHAEEAVTKKVQ